MFVTVTEEENCGKLAEDSARVAVVAPGIAKPSFCHWCVVGTLLDDVAVSVALAPGVTTWLAGWVAKSGANTLMRTV